MCQAAISSYRHYLPKSSALPPSGCCEDLHLMQEDRLPSPFRTQGWERHSGTHRNPHPRLSSEAATWTPSETSSHRGTSPPCQTSSMRWRSLLAVSPIPGMLFGTAKVLNTFFFAKAKQPYQRTGRGPSLFTKASFQSIDPPGPQSPWGQEWTRV